MCANVSRFSDESKKYLFIEQLRFVIVWIVHTVKLYESCFTFNRKLKTNKLSREFLSSWFNQLTFYKIYCLFFHFIMILLLFSG